jgi:hypothetical protein
MRSGVGLKDSAILGDMEGVRGLWAVKTDAASEYVRPPYQHLIVAKAESKGLMTHWWSRSLMKLGYSGSTPTVRLKNWTISRDFALVKRL